MKLSPKSWGLVACLTLAAALPLCGHWLRGPRGPACALDGLAIDPTYRVLVTDQRGEHAFCSPRCAQLWIGKQTQPPIAVHVTDEVSGDLLDAASAWYVRSPVVTVPATGNRLHVFRARADAVRHVRQYGGTMLDEEPFSAAEP